MIFIIHRSWEYFRGNLPGTFSGKLRLRKSFPKVPGEVSKQVPTNMLVELSYEHVGRARWSNLFREPFREPLLKPMVVSYDFPIVEHMGS